MAIIVWFRHDLRLADNEALYEAAVSGDAVIPVYVWSPEEEGAWPPGRSVRWWLSRSLASLGDSLQRLGSRLVVCRGPALEVLPKLAEESGCSAVHWSTRYDPPGRAQEEAVRHRLVAMGRKVRSFDTSTLLRPDRLVTTTGGPFRVFTPFHRAMLDTLEQPIPLRAPTRLPAPPHWPVSEPIDDLEPPEAPDLAADEWPPGEDGAWQTLSAFVERSLDRYGEERDMLGRPSVSRLSPRLRFGEISPRQIWHALSGHSGAGPFLRQLAWREFAYHLLWHFPETAEQPLRPEFAACPWRYDGEALRTWQHGRTGYPIVDAAMRQLLKTGWMHNRARMVVASFLTKDLLVPWLEGARWFWEHLMDADLANNTLGWQWTAGCGADAAPYFRIFNPVTQAMRFDPDGAYVRRWLPELAGLPDDWLHRPWEAPEEVLAKSGVRLGDNYPAPLVDHARARTEAMAAYYDMMGKRSTAT